MRYQGLWLAAGLALTLGAPAHGQTGNNGNVIDTASVLRLRDVTDSVVVPLGRR